jgi:hypothetical protein
VTDSSGALVADANVTVTNVATNGAKTVKTSNAGTYTITELLPGQYTVKVDKSGFKSYVQNDITLQIDQVSKIDAQLEVGSAETTVVVTSTAPVIQTTDSSVGLVVDSQAIQNTPLNGRLSVMGLIAIAPGVQGAGAQDQLAVRGITPSIGTGTRNSYGGMGDRLDGVTNQEVTLERGEAEIPSLDAISEFKFISTGAPAEFNEPAQLVIVSASGGNQFHGEAFEYNRSKGTGAKEWVAGALPRPPYQRNEYGGNFSGPITIPHLYDGKDRSFFFVAFEGLHLTQAFPYSTQQPTALERQGIFSEFLAGGVCEPTTIIGGVATPTPLVINNPAAGGTPFSGNIIPTANQNSVDQQLLSLLYPTTTLAGCGTNTIENVTYHSNATRWSLHLDHKINDHNQIRATFLRAFYGPNPDSDVDSKQGGYSGDGEHNTNTIVGWTHTFSPTLLVDSYASFFHLPIYRTPQNVNTDFSSIIPGLGAELIEGAPTISITNITGVSEAGSKDLEQVFQANSALTKIFPKHAVKAGFTYLYDDHWNDSASSPTRGSYTFNGNYSGNAFADFILGYPSATGHATPNNYITKNLSDQYAAFVQDDWKLLPNLTINMGIRYDLQWFLPNPYSGNNSLYIPSLKEVVVFGSSYPSDALANFLPGGASGIPIALSSAVGLPSNPFSYVGRPDKNFAPRFGFAYEPIHNTVVRGAIGIYFNLLPASYVGTSFGTLPFLSSESYTNSTSKITTPTFSMSNPFSATGVFGANPAVSAQHALETPYTEEYNLAVEHQFEKGLDIRIGYVGQHNLRQNNASGSGNVAPNINLLNPPVVGSTVQSTNLVQPFAGISLYDVPIFHSMMNSLQVGVHKQYSHGLSFNAEYQWTRVLGTENLENPSGAAPADSKGNIAGVTPQVLAVTYSYALPFGKNHMLFGNANDFEDKLINGWQVSGISTFQSGQPFSVSYTAPGSTTGQVSGRANRVMGVPLYPSTKTKTQWFNPAAFTAPICYNSVETGSATVPCSAVYAAGQTAGVTTYDTYGNSGYDMLRGPRFQDWDMNLEKNTLFGDRYRLQLRIDSFNIFNHPNLGNPAAAISNTSTVGTITSVSSSPSAESRKVEIGAKFSF